jgi:hypothetical protein
MMHARIIGGRGAGNAFGRLAQRCRTIVGAALLAGMLGQAPAEASHSWGTYHWARTSNPFTLKLGDNVHSTWDPYLAQASTDWSQSSVLDTVVVPGSTDPKRCRPTTGRVDVCAERYGFNGWLGVAQIWVNGSHITQATVKLNDSYFSTSKYNTPAWRRLVVCQEVGHTFGLDHQDENFSNSNLGTCMDYTNDPDGPPSNEHPNQHDYDELALIYGHFDSTTTIAAAAPGSGAQRPSSEGGEGPADWGRPVRIDRHGQPILFHKDLGSGRRLVTWVFWAEPDARNAR